MNGYTRAPLAILAVLVALAMSACSNRTHVTNTDTSTPASVLTGDEPLEPELLSDEFSIDDFESESQDELEEDARDEDEELEGTPSTNDAPSPWAWLA